jgi:hypothetical protein
MYRPPALSTHLSTDLIYQPLITVASLPDSSSPGARRQSAHCCCHTNSQRCSPPKSAPTTVGICILRKLAAAPRPAQSSTPSPTAVAPVHPLLFPIPTPASRRILCHHSQLLPLSTTSLPVGKRFSLKPHAPLMADALSGKQAWFAPLPGYCWSITVMAHPWRCPLKHSHPSTLSTSQHMTVITDAPIRPLTTFINTPFMPHPSPDRQQAQGSSFSNQSPTPSPTAVAPTRRALFPTPTPHSFLPFYPLPMLPSDQRPLSFCLKTRAGFRSSFSLVNSVEAD